MVRRDPSGLRSRGHRAMSPYPDQQHAEADHDRGRESTACTQKNAVGVLFQCSPSHARSSSTIALANRGQITTLNTPATMRNRAASLVHRVPMSERQLAGPRRAQRVGGANKKITCPSLHRWRHQGVPRRHRVGQPRRPRRPVRRRRRVPEPRRVQAVRRSGDHRRDHPWREPGVHRLPVSRSSPPMTGTDQCWCSRRTSTV